MFQTNFKSKEPEVTDNSVEKENVDVTLAGDDDKRIQARNCKRKTDKGTLIFLSQQMILLYLCAKCHHYSIQK